MNIQFLSVQIFKSDVIESWRFACSAVLPRTNISNTYDIVGTEFFVAKLIDGVLANYEPVDGEIPADAVETTRLKDKISGKVIWILGNQDDFATLCNTEANGAVPEMNEVTLPAVYDYEEPEAYIAEDGSTKYKFTASHVAAIQAGQKLQISFSDGTQTLTGAGGGYTTIALALAYAQANWAAYGTWTAVGTKGIQLVSGVVKKGFIKLELLNQDFCLTVVGGDVFDTVKIGEDTFTLENPVTVVSAAQLLPILKPYFGDGTLSSAIALKLQYNGPSVPLGIYLGAAAVRSFVAGACA